MPSATPCAHLCLRRQTRQIDRLGRKPLGNHLDLRRSICLAICRAHGQTMARVAAIHGRTSTSRLFFAASVFVIPTLQQVTPDTPLRLRIAAALAYPDGSMTASGLRKEAGRGRLVIERTAGKDYTTLAAIEDMRRPCRLQPRGHDCGSVAN